MAADPAALARLPYREAVAEARDRTSREYLVALLAEFGIGVYSWVVRIGEAKSGPLKGKPETLGRTAEASPVRCPDKAAAKAMMEAIDAAKKAGDSLGGVFEVVVTGCPPGLGSYAQRDRTRSTTLCSGCPTRRLRTPTSAK